MKSFSRSFSRPPEKALFYLYEGLRELKASPGCSTYMKGSEKLLQASGRQFVLPIRRAQELKASPSLGRELVLPI